MLGRLARGAVPCSVLRGSGVGYRESGPVCLAPGLSLVHVG